MPRKTRTIPSRSTSAAAATPATRTAAAPATVDFNPDYTSVKRDLKRIGILAGSFFAVMVVLAFVLPLVIR